LGDLARAEGDLAAARTRYAAALGVGRARGAQSLLGLVRRALRKVAGLRAAAGDPRRAARLFGAAEAAGGDRALYGLRTDRWEEDLWSARAALDEATFAAAWAEGEAMTLEEAIADALGDESAADARAPGGSAEARGGSLA